jgi:phosphatidylglycerophosphate synthase
VEEPTNRYVYYPIAKRIVQVLLKTPITANQVTLVQPLIAAVAAYLIAHGSPMYLIAGALVFELRSLLDCVDGSLARAKNQASPNGHALDALCDWLGVVLLYLGIYLHFRSYAPPSGVWMTYLPMGAIIGISLFQGAMRSFAADYYMRKYGSILERGRDETVEDLRDRQRALGPDSTFLARAEAWIGRCQHLSFQHEPFDAERSVSLSGAQADVLIAQRSGPLMRFVAALWSISSGDAYIRLTVLSVLAGHAWMWSAQLFFATVGFVWIVAVIMFNGWVIRRAIGRSLAPSEV